MNLRQNASLCILAVLLFCLARSPLSASTRKHTKSHVHATAHRSSTAHRHRRATARRVSSHRRTSSAHERNIASHTRRGRRPHIRRTRAEEKRSREASHEEAREETGARLLPAMEKVPVPQIHPKLYDRRGHLIVPPPMRGSHEILVHQNLVADKYGLSRIENDAQLDEMRESGLLVALPVNAGIRPDRRLPLNRRYARPWTVRFLEALARAHYARFHRPLQVNSAVRTVEFQEHLQRINGNAAPVEGDTASPHLTGQAVDLAKHGLSRTEIAWMRGYLLPLVQEGKIDVEEEFQQACFHISVYKNYIPAPAAPRRSIAARHKASATALAVAIH